MPLRRLLPRGALPVHRPSPPVPVRCRAFHASRRRLLNDVQQHKNYYERLKVRHDASPADIKKSFYALSKTHHPDANPGRPGAAHTFSLLSEAYTVLSDAGRRAAYDRQVLASSPSHHAHQPPRGSYHSTNPAGGRTPSGLSRRRGTFHGPPPSFYRSGGWGAQSEKRRRAHEESTGGWSDASPDSSASSHQSAHGGMGPGDDPFGHHQEVPHFDKEGHTRTHRREDRRRWQRAHRAVGDDDIEFEPQTSIAGHFIIISGILAATLLAPLVYIQFMRLGRTKKRRHD